MRVSENFAQDIAVRPRALAALERLEGTAIHHEAHRLRHPLAAYRISYSTVLAKTLAVLECLDAVPLDPSDAASSSAFGVLLEATDQWLDSLMEHMDDCRGVLVSQFAPRDPAAEPALRKYGQAVKPYRDHIGRIDNCLKHKQGRLRAVSFIWRYESCHGYYVEGPIGSGLGPSEEIHGPDGTAFSYNRSIRFHLCHVFAVSDRLAAALHAIPGRATMDSETPASGGAPKAIELAARLPIRFFPDEVRQPVPLVAAAGNGYTIEYPSLKTRPTGPPILCMVTTSARGDGVTKSFKLPYLKRPSQ
jgi:hypothetical protein